MTAGHGRRNVSVIFCNYDTYLSVHIMKWFDAMCEEPFDAVAKVVECVSEYDETKWFDTMCEESFLARKETFPRPQ